MSETHPNNVKLNWFEIIRKGVGSDRSNTCWSDIELEILCATEELDKPYYIWPKGTDKEDIWHWFDEHHSKGVAYLLGFAD